MATAVKAFMALALALALVMPAANADVVCALPANALYLGSSDAQAGEQPLTACLSGSASGDGLEVLDAECETACACRQLRSDANLYAVCVNISAVVDCSNVSNATDCSNVSLLSEFKQVVVASGSASLSVDASGSVGDTHDSSAIAAADTKEENASSGSGSSSGGLKAWVWVVIALAIVLVLGLLLFLFNWFKHRPLRGDNRGEVAQAVETSRSQPKDSDLAPVGIRESAARTTERSDPSQTSHYSSGSYHKTFAAGTSASTLTETELEIQREGGERVFSPISSHSSQSVGSSNFSQGVDTADAALLAPERTERDYGHSRPHAGDQALTSFSEYSMSSDMGSFSSQITVEDESDLDTSTAPYPRKKSIEF